MICPDLVRFIGLLVLGKLTVSEGLSCYQCNADLSMGLKEECNDPYAPGPAIDLVECPQNESHYCLKAAIYYKNVHATVRGCVPLRWKNTYCSPRDEFAEARVTCKFCNENACNASWIPVMNGDSITSIFIVVVMNFVLG